MLAALNKKKIFFTRAITLNALTLRICDSEPLQKTCATNLSAVGKSAELSAAMQNLLMIR